MHCTTHRYLGIPAMALALLAGAAALPSGPVAAAQSQVAVKEGDAQVVMALIQVNTEEVSAARAALPSLKNERVRDFAQEMITDHGQALKKVQAIGSRLGVTDSTQSDSAAHRPDMAVPSTDSIARSGDSTGRARMGQDSTMNRSGMGQDSAMNRSGMGQDSTNRMKHDSMPTIGGNDSTRQGMGMGVGQADTSAARQGNDSSATGSNRNYNPADSTGASVGSGMGDKAYIDAQVADHQKVLSELKGMKRGIKDSELRKYVADTESSVKAHLKKAQKLQKELGKSA